MSKTKLSRSSRKAVVVALIGAFGLIAAGAVQLLKEAKATTEIDVSDNNGQTVVDGNIVDRSTTINHLDKSTTINQIAPSKIKPGSEDCRRLCQQRCDCAKSRGQDVGHFCSEGGTGWSTCMAGDCNNRNYLNCD